VGHVAGVCQAGFEPATLRAVVLRTFIGRHRDADAQAITRVVRQSRAVVLAFVGVFHIVAGDAALCLGIATWAVIGRRTIVLGDLVTDGAACDRTGHRCRLAAVALADLVAQGAADDRAQYRGASGVATMPTLHASRLGRRIGHISWFDTQ